MLKEVKAVISNQTHHLLQVSAPAFTSGIGDKVGHTSVCRRILMDCVGQLL